MAGGSYSPSELFYNSIAEFLDTTMCKNAKSGGELADFDELFGNFLFKPLLLPH